jgi:3-oxoacyl-[acyl-carrier protein] reductase
VELGLRGRPALVAAASRGLGRACAEALAAEGARVAICSRDEAAIAGAAGEIAGSTGGEVVPIVADVSTREGAEAFVRQGADALGGCEILVPNAGGPDPGTISSLTDEDYQSAFELSFQSTVRMGREALPHMRAAGYGRIVVIGSITMKQPMAGLMLSNAVRLGIAGWAKTAAVELAPDGITVNVVLPGTILTDRTRQLVASDPSGGSLEEKLAARAAALPMGRMGEPRELGDLVAFLASERAAYLTGQFVLVDGAEYRGLF